MEVHRPERRTRSSSTRKPLSDLTNALSDTSSLKSKYKASGPRSALSSNLHAVSAKSSSSIGSSGPGNPRNRRIPNNSGSVTSEKSKHAVVFTQQGTESRKDKGKTVASAIALSCPQQEKIRNTRGNLKVEKRDVLHSALPAPCKKRKMKQQDHTPVQDSLMPLDYIEKQRAYFAEIDAFDLAEEVVSENELE